MYGFAVFLAIVIALIVVLTTGYAFTGFGIFVVGLIIFGLFKLAAGIAAASQRSK